MTTHHFQPDHYHTTIGAHDPVLRIADGDTVVTTTVDAMGKDASDMSVTPRGNPMTGPFYVEGAEPGDTLALLLDRLGRRAERGRSLGCARAARPCAGRMADRSRAWWDGHAGEAGDETRQPDAAACAHARLFRCRAAAWASDLDCHIRRIWWQYGLPRFYRRDDSLL